MVFKGFLGPTYSERSKPFAAQRCINLYPLLKESGETKENIALIGTPGLDSFATIGSGQVRGSISVGSYVYVVVGNKLYRVRNDATFDEIGTITTSTGIVSIANNNRQICIVDGAKVHIYNFETEVFSIPASQPISPPTSVTFIDQYFIVSMVNSKQFQISGLNDGTSWSSLDVANAEASPDLLLACSVSHKQLYLFGESTTEIWYDAGTSPFPFQLTSGVIDYGIDAIRTPVNIANTLTWLGTNKLGAKQILSVIGADISIISTPALEQEWSSYSVTSDAYAFGYEQEGNIFYVITFPSPKTTFVYDFRTKLWHERSSFNLEQWRVSTHSKLVDKHIVGDFFTNKLYVMKTDKYTEDTDAIIRTRVAPVLWNDRKQFITNSLEVEFESGVGDGTDSTPGDDPLVRLRWSNDGGHTWSNYYTSKIGQQGRFEQRAIWRKLGLSRERVFEVTTSAPVKIAIIGASIETTAGHS